MTKQQLEYWIKENEPTDYIDMLRMLFERINQISSDLDKLSEEVIEYSMAETEAQKRSHFTNMTKKADQALIRLKDETNHEI